MTDILAFVTARLAEDWGEARDGELAAGLDESRATRRVDAMRAILADHADDGYGSCITCAEPHDEMKCECHWSGHRRELRDYPCLTVQALAAIYSDHPDYEPA